MIAIAETDDAVRLHYLKMVLEAAGLHPFIFETNSSYRSLPSRLMVPKSEEATARRTIAEAEGDLSD